MKTFKYILLTLLACQLWAGCGEIESPVNTIPTVTTGEVTEITATSAMIWGDIIPPQRYQDWGKGYFIMSTTADMSNPETYGMYGFGDSLGGYNDFFDFHFDNGLFSHNPHNLQPGTTYYVALCATDGLTTIQGNVVSFTTTKFLSLASLDVAPLENSGVKENTPFKADDRMGVLLGVQEGKDFSIQWNKSYSGPFTGNIVPDNTPKKLYAYYPYNSNYTNIPVNLDGGYEYLYGSSEELTASNTEAHITMKNATARVTFSITKAKEYTANDVVTAVELSHISGYGTVITGTGRMNGLTGVITPLEGKSIYKKVSFEPLTDKANVVEMQVIPTKFADGEVSFRLYSNAYAHAYTHTATLPAITWEAGKQYTYTVEITDSSLNISEASITPWENSNQDPIKVGDNNYVE
jgi:hypothetical protein